MPQPDQIAIQLHWLAEGLFNLAHWLFWGMVWAATIRGVMNK